MDVGLGVLGAGLGVWEVGPASWRLGGLEGMWNRLKIDVKWNSTLERILASIFVMMLVDFGKQIGM